MPIEIHNLSTLQQQGYLPVDIHSAFFLNSSNEVVAPSTAQFNLLSTGALSSANPATINISSAGAAVTFVVAGVATPPDWSTVDGITLHMTGRVQSAASSALTHGWQITAMDPTAGGISFSSGQFGAAAATSSGIFHVTGTLSSGSTPGANSAMTVSVTTSTGGDKYNIGALWMVYGRKRRG